MDWWAISATGDPRHHRTTFVAAAGELVAGGAKAVVWQQGGTGVADHPPAPIAPDTALADIVAWTERLRTGAPASGRPTPTLDLDALYPADVRATTPDPARQLAAALAVQLTRADKATLDVLAAWPLCTRQQLAGLLGGDTRHRAGQALQSLLRRGLVRAEGPQYVLTDDALKYLAHRDRAAVGPTLAQWSTAASTCPPQPATGSAPAYAGTALRALAAQPAHQAGLTDFAAALSAAVVPPRTTSGNPTA